VVTVAVGADKLAAVDAGAQPLAKGFGTGGKAFLDLKERGAKDLSVLGLGGSAVRRGPLFQGANDLFVDISHGQLCHRFCLQRCAINECITISFTGLGNTLLRLQ